MGQSSGGASLGHDTMRGAAAHDKAAGYLSPLVPFLPFVRHARPEGSGRRQRRVRRRAAIRAARSFNDPPGARERDRRPCRAPGAPLR